MWDRTKMTALLKGRAEKIRLIAADLDGTLLDGNSALTERTVRAVAMARAKGADFTICTGRGGYELGALPLRLGLRAPIICRNGAEIVDPVDGRALMQVPLPREESIALVRFLLENGLDFSVTTHEAMFFPKNTAMMPFFRQHERQAGAGSIPAPKMLCIQRLEQFDPSACCKMILVRHQPKYPLAEAFLAKCPGIQVIAAADEIVDLIGREASKGAGLRWVAEHLDVPREACCAFGDYANDVSMLRYAGLSFAMENAAPDVKRASTFTAPPNTEDGVAQVLELLFGDGDAEGRPAGEK